jgi:hypothetical protein
VTDPLLRRAVWLTEQQRERLLTAALLAYTTEGSDRDLCNSLISELILLQERLGSAQPLIRALVSGLRLPADALPVYLCQAEVREVRKYGALPADFVNLLDPALPIPRAAGSKPRRT